ncbi:MAG: FAD-binding oxidoreductase [Deltaproteobacteria bacterium]|nr:MAG: FAD-binding oxidoreductase [Deltaproteobacteria bacterium]
MRCTILGAGVSGLTTALAMLQAGGAVTVVSDRFTPHTTSDVPAAFFFPYGVEPSATARRWIRVSYRIFARLARDPGTGVRARRAVALVGDRAFVRWLQDAVVGVAAPRAVGPSVRFEFTSFVVDVRRYLPWLMDRIEALGGRCIRRHVASFDEVDGDVVIDCTGLGARPLARDPTLVPARGQIVRLSAMDIDHVYVDERIPEAPLYIVPRSDDCIVGGTFEPGVSDLRPDPAIRKRLLERASSVVPAVASAQVIEDRVGLRPVRPRPRVELEILRTNGRPLVHNYGHGGAGITLSWGCAAQARALALAAWKSPHASHRSLPP